MFFIFLFAFFSLAAEENPFASHPFANTLGTDDALVEGRVNAITGHSIEERTDLQLAGIAELPFHFSYYSADFNFSPYANRNDHTVDFGLNAYGWVPNFKTFVEGRTYEGNTDSAYLICHLGSGVSLPLSGKVEKIENKRVKLKVNNQACKGITNGFQFFPNGQTNLKNVSAPFLADLRVDQPYCIKLGNGETRTYTAHPNNGSHLPIEICRPNGHRVLFDFSDGCRVRIVNAAGDVEFGWYHLKDGKLSCSDGRSVSYKTASNLKDEYAVSLLGPYLEEVSGDGILPVRYEYAHTIGSRGSLSSLIYPEGRIIGLVHYDELPKTKYYDAAFDYGGRVNQICELVGPDDLLYYTAWLNYNKVMGKTEVWDALNRKTIYHYCQNQRLTKKEFMKFDAKKNKHLLESYYTYLWSDKIVPGKGNLKEKDFGNLMSKSLKDAAGNCLASTSYVYDDFGNVLTHTITGNLTGKGDSSFSKTYTYSDGTFNLMLSESDGKLTTRMAYKPDTNLLTRKRVEVEGKTVQREFHTYDGNATLVETIIDDGCGDTINDLTRVTERQITRITPKKEAPGIGLPEVIEELYLENGVEKLLRKTVSLFSREGWKEQEEIYDAEGMLVYTLYWKYNSYGQPVEWNDALGNLYKKTYDANGNCLEEWGPRHDCYTSYMYDLANRCIEKAFHTAEGDILTETYTYDLCSNRTSLTDHAGAVTQFSYDHRNRLSKTTNPLNETTELTYDLLGHLASSKDGRGNITKTQHTAYDRPYRIDYPDGSFEEMTYSVDGFLIQKINRNGSITKKYYDPLNREILEELYSSNGAFITSFSKAYNAFHLLSETDGEGHTTHYAYDGAGRKIEERRGLSITQYAYDSLGRIQQERRWDGKEWMIKSFTYDLLDRVLSETVEGYSHRSFAYNATGQLIEETTMGTTLFEYDSKERLIKKTDPLGDIDYYIYDDFNRIHSHIDPLGLQTITYHDVLNRPVKVEKTKEALLSTILTSYDAAGNHIVQHIILPDRTVTNRWEYDSLNRPITEIKGAGTKEETITRTTYSLAGEKQRVIKPDGVILKYTYTPAGELETLHSSDGTVSYHIAYNRIGQVIEAKDLTTGLSTFRSYNEEGLLASETFAHGLTLSFSYDPLQRTHILYLPDSTLQWDYQGPYLSSVSKGNKTVLFPSYDIAGNLLEMEIPSLGSVRYERDLMGRPILVKTPVWEMAFIYDPVGNIIQKRWKDVIYSYTYDSLYQLLSETDHLYQYDNLYNRTEKDHEKTAYNALNQSISLSYDLNGNLLELNGHSFRYDALDRLISTGDTTCTYDFFNRRVTKNNDRYLYHGQNEIGCPDRQELRLLANGRGAEIGASVLLELQGASYFPLHDEQGSIVTLLHSNGTIAEETLYTAFGEETPTHPLSPWRFSSKRFDPESSLIYFGRRYYSPSLGRWTTSDPAGYSDGPNLYAYVHNNPLTHIDLYGLMELIRNDRSHDSQRKKERTSHFINKEPEKDRRRILERVAATVKDTAATVKSSAITATNAATDFFFSGIKECCNLPPNATLWQRSIAAGKASLDVAALVPAVRLITLTANSVKVGTTLSKTIQASRSLRITNQVEKTAQVGKIGEQSFELNRFHQAAHDLTEVGQNNIRILRGWAKSKGWIKAPNNGGPEKWGQVIDGKFNWNLRIKPESSLRPGLDAGSMQPRFDARLGTESPHEYLNPFIGIKGSREMGTHILLE